MTWTGPAILDPPFSILDHRPSETPVPGSSLHFVSELPGDFSCNPIVGDFFKCDFSIRELARGLEGFYDLVDALVRRHAVAADRLSINRVSIFR